MNSEPMSNMGIGQKLSLLAHLLKRSQGGLAEKCQISRISVNRFFRGRSEIRASDFVALLKEMDLDVEAMIDSKLKATMSGGSSLKEEVFIQDAARLLSALDAPVRKSLIDQVLRLARGGSVLEPVNIQATDSFRR